MVNQGAVNKVLRLGSLGWEGDIPFSCDALRLVALDGRVLLDDSPEGVPPTAFPVDGWHSPLTENSLQFFMMSLLDACKLLLPCGSVVDLVTGGTG